MKFKALCIALLLTGTSHLPVTAQQTDIDALIQDLRLAMCVQDWNSALGLTSQIIGSPDLPAEYRQSYVNFRYQIEGYRSSNARFESVQGCEGVEVAAPTSQPEETPSTGFVSEERWQWAVDTVEAGAGQSGSSNNSNRPNYGSQWGDTGWTQRQGSGSGRCNSPNDIDAAGRRCGGRASSVRPGGRP